MNLGLIILRSSIAVFSFHKHLNIFVNENGRKKNKMAINWKSEGSTSELRFEQFELFPPGMQSVYWAKDGNVPGLISVMYPPHAISRVRKPPCQPINLRLTHTNHTYNSIGSD